MLSDPPGTGIFERVISSDSTQGFENDTLDDNYQYYQKNLNGLSNFVNTYKSKGKSTTLKELFKELHERISDGYNTVNRNLSLNHSNGNIDLQKIKNLLDSIFEMMKGIESGGLKDLKNRIKSISNNIKDSKKLMQLCGQNKDKLKNLKNALTNARASSNSTQTQQSSEKSS